MPKRGDSLFKRTKKTISVLVFETTKHSRIMKKRMRIGALQKVLKADYRDLGHIVYDAVAAGKGETFLKDEDFIKFVANITRHNNEMERLREGIARISRAKKTFGQPALLPQPAAETGAAPIDQSKRGFLGLKRKKASEELVRMVAEELAGSPLSTKKEKRGFLGFGKKKAKEAEAKAVEPREEAKTKPEAKKEKAKSGFLGLRKKNKSQAAPTESPAAAEKPAKPRRNLFGMKKKPAKAQS